ncbi:hypothetical protein AX15_003367 [Amanita polypyramis BW_CC]|nr:hypothetical protein AX15_003367 [Amanita polypyramis BW_CC]
MAAHLLLLAALSTLVVAYSGTYPIIAWSSAPSSILQSLPTSFERPDSPLTYITTSSDVCDHDVIIIIEHPGTHASLLRSLSPSSGLARRYLSSPSIRHYPYVPFDSNVDITSEVDMVSQRCGSRAVKLSPGESVTFDLDHKHIIHLTIPLSREFSGSRKNAMDYYDTILSTELDSLTAIFPDHLAIYTGAPLPPGFAKRQAPEIPERPVLELSGESFVPSTTAMPGGGILKRYQLLTPALISALLVVLFVLLPIIMLGISALASIQSPLKVEVPKSYNAREKKIQ